MSSWKKIMTITFCGREAYFMRSPLVFVHRKVSLVHKIYYIFQRMNLKLFCQISLSLAFRYSYQNTWRTSTLFRACYTLYILPSLSFLSQRYLARVWKGIYNWKCFKYRDTRTLKITDCWSCSVTVQTIEGWRLG